MMSSLLWRRIYVVASEPKGMTKGEKANLRRKCKNNFKFETGMLYYKKDGIDEASKWKICVRSDDEKRRILDHAILE